MDNRCKDILELIIKRVEAPVDGFRWDEGSRKYVDHVRKGPNYRPITKWMYEEAKSILEEDDAYFED